MESRQARAQRLAESEAASAVSESRAAERSRRAELLETERLRTAEHADAGAAVIRAHRRALDAHRRATEIHVEAERVHRAAASLQREHAAHSLAE